MRKAWLNILLVVAMILITATPAFAQEPTATPLDSDGSLLRENAVFLPIAGGSDNAVDVLAADEADAAASLLQPASATALALPEPLEATSAPANLNPVLDGATGRVAVVVRLNAPGAAEFAGNVAAADAAGLVVAAAASEVQAAAASEQSSVLDWIRARDPSAKVLATLRVALNAVIVEVDASILSDLVGVQGVSNINPVVDYERDLTDTVPAIGASEVQASGVDGTGVVVAVLDSGIDYTHVAFGGEGTDAAYEAAFGVNAADPRNTTRDGLFPTAKVIDGWDFVGEAWAGGTGSPPLAPDEDPIDNAPNAGGHGTHVADIIAGVNGVAPGASLMAVKVCSAVSTSCSGVALLQGMEFALDPNGDADMSDAVDIINMSLGSSYGQREDDLSLASTNAVNAGVVVVASAGNSADRPYITGSPASTPEVISVAQTTVPSETMFVGVVESLPAPVPLVPQPWGGTPVLTSAELAYPAVAAERNGCAVIPAGTYAGKTLLLDRGACNISTKAFNAENAGAIAVIIGNNVAQGPGDPAPIFSSGGEVVTIPTYTATLADANILRTVLGEVITIDPASAVSIAMNMVASSSRGPSYSYIAIKPDLGAPGASVSALVGTGTGTEAFGGTSGAAPMVAGSAALLLDARPGLATHEVKALLVQTADPNVYINSVALPGYLAPITRIGGGEVRVNNAVVATVAAWEKDTLLPSLSFGYQNPTDTNESYSASLVVRNFSNTEQTFSVAPSMRYADDVNAGVTIATDGSVAVEAHGTAEIAVNITIDVTQLPAWQLNGGARGGDGYRLQGSEFDGYITLTETTSGESIHVPWHILPRPTAGIYAQNTDHEIGSRNMSVNVRNYSRVPGAADAFALLHESPRIPQNELPGPGDNFAIIDLHAVGARLAYDANSGLELLQIGISTYGTRSHPAYPALFDVYIDIDGDGVDDYNVWTQENGAAFSTGQTVVWVWQIGAPTQNAYYYADADLNSGNMIMTVPLAAIGATADTQLSIDVLALDYYFGSGYTDAAEDLVFTPGNPRYGPEGSASGFPYDQWVSFKPYRIAGGEDASPSQIGILLLYRGQKEGEEASVIRVH